MKTLDINAKEWFDKANGNSYFSAVVIINYGHGAAALEQEIKLPFQYGYGEHYKTVALQMLKKEELIPSNVNSLWRWCDENKVILRCSKQENCLKRDLNGWR